MQQLFLVCTQGFCELMLVCCRKKKAVHKATTTDDKRLQSTLKRLNVNTIPSIEQVMLIKDDMVTVFDNPKGTCRAVHAEMLTHEEHLPARACFCLSSSFPSNHFCVA